MFPHRILPEEELDEDNEASDLFNKKAKELLKKLAPTKEEKAIMSQPRGRPPLSTVRKKLNFDESFTFDAPSIGRQKCQLAEYEEQLDRLKRKNEVLEKEVQILNTQNEKLTETTTEMRQKISSLKQQLSEANLDKVCSSKLDESILDRYEIDQICSSANKYMSWFNTAINQLRVADEILKQNGLLTRENKQKLIEAERIYPVDKDVAGIAALAAGSVLDFPGLQSLRLEDQEPFYQETGNSRLRFSPIVSPAAEETIENTLLNTTINTSMSSIDCENQEKLLRLEQQNSLLVDKLKVASHRAHKTLVLEEEKRSLEQKVAILDSKLQDTLKEIAQLRKINADNMHSKETDGDTYRKALENVDRLVKETDAGDTTQIFHMANNPLSLAHYAHIEESRKRKASGSLEEEIESKRSKDEDLQSLKKHLEKLEKERETQQKIQDDTLKSLKRFRELTTFLTGYQLKVTDFEEGLVTVSSIYDPENKQFAFKVGTQNVDLLDLGYNSSQSLSWDNEARYFINERSSVPAFLAKVTLTLEEQRELEVVERTHMFSVLEE